MKSETLSLIDGRKDIWMKTYIWEDSLQLLNGKARPAVVVLAGGGYLQAGDNEAEPVALKFASMGYHAFVLHYTTYNFSFEEFFGLFASMDGSPEQTQEFLKKYPFRPERGYPVPMLDVGRAMLLIRSHAEEWHVDMDRIALCGFSAGAHNASMFAVNWQNPIITNILNCKKEEIRPAALILGYTISDYEIMNVFREKTTPTNAEFFDIANQIYSGQPVPDDETVAKISPARMVTRNMVPTFLWACADDSLVPVQNTLAMANALADQQIPFEVHIYEHAAHGIGLGTQASAGTKEQIFEDAGKWSDLAGKWLEKRFALPLD